MGLLGILCKFVWCNLRFEENYWNFSCPSYFMQIKYEIHCYLTPLQFSITTGILRAYHLGMLVSWLFNKVKFNVKCLVEHNFVSLIILLSGWRFFFFSVGLHTIHSPISLWIRIMVWDTLNLCVWSFYCWYDCECFSRDKFYSINCGAHGIFYD